jgi:prepilin-type N-terminal cleavage/methylation domain-containing protein
MKRVLTRTPRGRRSYTLIELLIVVALLGIAGALLVPHMVGQDNMQLQAAVRQIIGDLSFAQSDALAHQEYRRVHFYDDGRGYALVRADASDYATAWATFDEDDIDYIHDPLAGAGELGRYIIDFDLDPRYRDVTITNVQLDSGGAGPEGDLVYDPLGGTIRAGDIPGTGGVIVVSSGDDSFTIDVAPFTGKLTVTE